MPTMSFYTSRDTDGNVHVQNAVAGMLGQHHVHSPEGFVRWRKPTDDIRDAAGPCDCTLEPGQARDGVSGKVTELLAEYR